MSPGAIQGWKVRNGEGGQAVSVAEIVSEDWESACCIDAVEGKWLGDFKIFLRRRNAVIILMERAFCKVGLMEG